MHTGQCYCTVFTRFRFQCHSAIDVNYSLNLTIYVSGGALNSILTHSPPKKS